MTEAEQVRLAFHFAVVFARPGEDPASFVAPVWFAMVRCLDNHDPAKGTLRTYFDRVALNAVRDARRYELDRGWSEKRPLPLLDVVDLDPPPCFEDATELSAMPRQLDSLPPLWREVVCLRAGIGGEPMQQRAIAVRLGISRARVNEILRNAYQVLRTAYGVRAPVGRSRVGA